MQLNLRVKLFIVGFILFVINYFLTISINNQIAFLVFSLILLGIPHGALDLYIDEHLATNKAKYRYARFFRIYLVNMLGYSLVWYFFPNLALGIFILITAYHFGEIDWIGYTHTFFQKTMYTLLGLGWILFLLSKNVELAIQVFMKMGNTSLQPSTYRSIANFVYPASFVLILVLLLLSFVFASRLFENKKQVGYLVAQTAILILSNLVLPLWLCFAFYFGVWHSILSFDKIRINFKYPNTIQSWKTMLFKALPFSFVAWFGIIYIIILTSNSQDNTRIFSILFVGISVLALPHLKIFTKLK